MRIKAGVQLSGVHYLMWIAAAYYDALRITNGLGEGTVTGGTEGADPVGPARVAASLHSQGRALDFRVTDVPRNLWEPLTQTLQQALGPSFDVILEIDHIHVEVMIGFAPRGV